MMEFEEIREKITKFLDILVEMEFDGVSRK